MAHVASVHTHTTVASRSFGAGVLRFAGSWAEVLPLGAIALMLRLWGISWGLPDTLHPDEPVVFNTVAQMLQRHSLDPQMFTYPSAIYYAFFAIGASYQALHGTSVGMALSTTGVGYLAGAGHYTNPQAVLWMRIGVAVICSVAIVLVYIAARLFVGRIPATVGALLLAVSTLHIDLSQIATTDGPAATAMALAALFSIVAVRTERRAAFWLAWTAVGVAMGVKYNAGASAIMPLTAYAIVKWRPDEHGNKPTGREILMDQRFLGIGLLPLAFLVTTPYALVEPITFLNDVSGVIDHYTTFGQLGQSESSLLSTLQPMFDWPELLLGSLACVGIVSSLLRRRREALVVASGAALYFLVVGTPKVFFPRNLAPLWPLLAILAAEGFAWLVILLGQAASRAPLPRLVQRPASGIPILTMGLVVLVGIIPMAGKTAQFVNYRASVDVRIIASEWITAHIPAGTSIADEAYGVTLDPHRYRIDFEDAGLSAHPLAWYPEHGYRYVVTSDLFFYRYFVAGSPYVAEQAYYHMLTTDWGTVVRTFVGVDVVGGKYGAHLYLIQVPQTPAA
jgi:hypothetical protein